MSHIHEHHGPGCTCGCEDHEHHEHHSHSGDPAHSLADNALVLSGQWTVRLSEPAASGEVAAEVAARLGTLAQRLAVDGVVPGHIKALIECGPLSAALSVTRVGTADSIWGRKWRPDVIVKEYNITVNVLALLNTDAVTQADLELLFGGREGEKT